MLKCASCRERQRRHSRIPIPSPDSNSVGISARQGDAIKSKPGLTYRAYVVCDTGVERAVEGEEGTIELDGPSHGNDVNGNDGHGGGHGDGGGHRRSGEGVVVEVVWNAR